MGHFLGKVTVFFASVCLLLDSCEVNMGTTVLVLAAMLIGMLGDLSRGAGNREEAKRDLFSSRPFALLCEFLYGAFFLAGVFWTPAIAMAAFIVYDVVRYKKLRLLSLWLFSAVWALLAGAVSFGVYSVILAFFAAELATLTAGNEKLNEERLKQRDAAVEQELLAERRNRELIEKQDANIYMATLQERNRIAREIHDNVGHMLTRSILQLGAIKVINRSEELKEPLETLHETLNTAMTSMRNSVHDLHDESVDLRSSIEKLMVAPEGVRLCLDYDMGQLVPKEVKYAFIAITKEALNNAVKYSDGDEITVILREHPGFYQLMISDNGSAGGTPGDDFTGGIGLQNMRERVAALGGTIKISAEDGFRIFVSVMKK